uniref:Late embryogenesis abundant protein LEA-2 subgroup domain-containing protein n=1 Tax=Kalanchoe fedtschenkoi TaxID=63787 RepID=A0A7N0TY51_KALFE
MSADCCKFCSSCVITLGVVCLFTWLAVRSPSSPKLSILFLHLPGLNTSSPAALRNASISFKLKLDNPNEEMGIRYSNLTLSFRYPSNQSSAIADITLPSFYQGHQKKAVKSGSGETRGVNWTEVAAAVNGTVSFRVDVDGSVRYKVFQWLTRRHGVSIRGVVGVDTQGVYASKKGVRLKSGSNLMPRIGCCWLFLLVFLAHSAFLGCSSVPRKIY